LAVINLYRNHY